MTESRKPMYRAYGDEEKVAKVSTTYPPKWVWGQVSTHYPPEWLWKLPLDFDATVAVLDRLNSSWWAGLRWGLVISVVVAVLAWFFR